MCQLRVENVGLELCIDRAVWQRNFAEDIINMMVEQSTAQLFCKVISHVQGCVNAFKTEKVVLHPFDEGVIFNIHMARL